MKPPSQNTALSKSKTAESTHVPPIIKTLPETATYRDEIIKPFIAETNDTKNPQVEEKESLPLMEIFTSCLLRERKYPLNIQLSDYKKDFPVVSLLPPDILLNEDKVSPPSCSFLFVIRDREKNEYFYTLHALPIHSILKNTGLTLMNNNKEVKAGQLIDSNNRSHFDLILHQGNTLKTVKFLCEGIEKNLSVTMKSEQSVISPFQLLKSFNEVDTAASGKRKCRILTYGKMGFANAISVLLEIDFDSLQKNTASALWMPQKDSLQVKVIHKPDVSLSQRRDPRKEKGRGVHKPIHTFSVFTIPNFFEQLPSDLKEEEYRSYSIKVTTECRSRLFVLEAGLFAPEILSSWQPAVIKQTEDTLRTYELPLVDSFSVMSVTPREAFQIFFTHRLENILINTTPKALNSNGKRKLTYRRGKAIKDNQVQIICSYDFHIQNPQAEEPVFIGSIKHREIYWNPGSYGLGWTHNKTETGYPLSLEQAVKDLSIRSEFLFLKLKNDLPSFLPVDFILPDEMIFFCGSIRPTDDTPVTQAIYEKKFPLDEMPLYLPVASFAAEKDFEEFLTHNKIAKCRLILQREGIVQYFSGDLKFILRDYSFFEELNRLSDEDTSWNFNTLSELLYWL